MARILVWYRVDNGPIMQGYAERTCSGDVIFDSADGVTPIEGAAAIPAPALPAETRIAPPHTTATGSLLYGYMTHVR